MIRNVDKWRAWEDEYIRRTPIDVAQNFRIADALYEHARAMGALPLADPWEGVEDKIRVARVFRSVSTSPTERGPSA